MFVDSHCHLHLLGTKTVSELDAVVENAKVAGVSHILCVGTRLEEMPTIYNITKHFKNVSASVGLHPNEVVEEEPTEEELVRLGRSYEVVAVGETGLDYYHGKRSEHMQERFRRHVRAALVLRKPLIIHSRAAPQDTVRILIEERAEQITGVMHCFTESWEMAEECLALGFYISFSGIVTFKNASEVQEVARKVPLNRLLIETDAPYLAPVPYRGKPNLPQYVVHVAEHIAQLKNITLNEVAQATSNNYHALFLQARS